MSDSSLTPQGSAYGTGAPAYNDTDLQRAAIQGRAALARQWAVRHAATGDQRRAAKWNRIADELLDRLIEVRGR
jgi:hypothetical protein